MNKHILGSCLLCAGFLFVSCSDDNPVTPGNTGFVSGRVTIDGVGAANVIIEARPYIYTEGNPKPEGAPHQAAISAAGDYRLELIPGSYRIYCSENSPYSRVATSRYPIEVIRGETTVLDVELKERRPVNLIACEDNARVLLTFEGAYEAQQKICYRSPAELNQFEPVDTITDDHVMYFYDSPPAIGSFKYWITAVNDSGETEPTEEVAVAFTGVPNAPTDFGVEIGPTYVYLSWSALSIGEFNIYRSLDGVDWTLIAGSDRRYYRDTLSENGTYYYRVTAVSQYGLESAPSPTVRAVFGGRYGPPTEVTADDMGSYIRVEWRSYHSDASYNVYRAMGAGGEFLKIAALEENFYIDRPLEYGLFRYQVTAFGPDSVESDRSMEVSVEFDGHLDPPSEVEAEAYGVYVQVEWEYIANSYHYGVYRSSDGGQNYLWLSDQGYSGYTDAPPEAGDYLYTVTSFTDDGVESEMSTPAAVFYPDTLGRPGYISVTSEGRRIEIWWVTVAGADGYQIFRAVEANGEYIMIQDYATGYQYYDSPDTAGYYFYKLRAFSRRGHLSAFSDVGYTYYTGEPEPPTIYQIIDRGYAVYMYWSGNYNEPDKSYIIYRATLEGGEYLAIDSTGETTYFDWLAEAGVYYYRLRAKEDGYYSDFTAPAWVNFTGRMNPPQINSCTDEGSYIFLSWYPSEGGDKYNIYRGTHPDSLARIGEMMQYYSINDVPPAEGRYYYAVQAETRAGLQSPLSSPAGVDFTP